jgi:hypothetical protein
MVLRRPFYNLVCEGLLIPEVFLDQCPKRFNGIFQAIQTQDIPCSVYLYLKPMLILEGEDGWQALINNLN